MRCGFQIIPTKNEYFHHLDRMPDDDEWWNILQLTPSRKRFDFFMKFPHKSEHFITKTIPNKAIKQQKFTLKWYFVCNECFSHFILHWLFYGMLLHTLDFYLFFLSFSPSHLIYTIQRVAVYYNDFQLWVLLSERFYVIDNCSHFVCQFSWFYDINLIMLVFCCYFFERWKFQHDINVHDSKLKICVSVCVFSFSS